MITMKIIMIKKEMMIQKVS